MTIRLSDTQLIVLTAACQRDDRLVLPLPEHLKGGAAHKVIDALIDRGLIVEVPAEPGQPVWRQDEDEINNTLVVTAAALATLGILPDEGHVGPGTGEASTTPAEADTAAVEPDTGTDGANTASGASGAETAATEIPDAPAQGPTEAPTSSRQPREGSKQAQLIAMLKSEAGVTIAEAAEALGWQHHTVRGALAGALKKKLGLTVVSEKVDGRGRVYRLGE